MNFKLNHIRMILVAPKYAGNVGSCARVAANFGVEDIYVVSPQCDFRDKEAYMYSTSYSKEYLDRVHTADTLLDALKDCKIAVAITRRTGTLSPQEIPLTELAALCKSSDNLQAVTPEQNSTQKNALIFGREDNCLTRAETFLCSHFCHIPTSDFMPTMNLSHAVAAILSRVYTDSLTQDFNKSIAHNDRVSVDEIEAAIDHWRQTMVDAQLVTGGDPEKLIKRIRRLLQKAKPNQKELAAIRRFLSKTQISMGTKKNNR